MEKGITEITLPALRVKVSGACNRSCNFCHEEGDMKTILPVVPRRKSSLSAPAQSWILSESVGLC